MSDLPSTGPAVRYLVHDVFAEAVYCRRTFAEAVTAADRIGCSIIIQSRYGDGHLLDPAGVVCRYRREGALWRIEAPPPTAGRPRGRFPAP